MQPNMVPLRKVSMWNYKLTPHRTEYVSDLKAKYGLSKSILIMVIEYTQTRSFLVDEYVLKLKI